MPTPSTDEGIGVSNIGALHEGLPLGRMKPPLLSYARSTFFLTRKLTKINICAVERCGDRPEIRLKRSIDR
ncbi:hypothetical protein Osc7112_4069 [Oscillatoria nigro-viridis PCC 7112]|uniref:Uncharacterized protein n=1 Tax=Phormidium nigroviride PCC 7112 TaxID=179408 RepID=K9VLI1_9CYAN|nr:hypothetical protein Osc7112_4069 [Oscillatoria nigro-viridis PCC 7112]